MSLSRRSFVRAAAALPVLGALPALARAPLTGSNAGFHRYRIGELELTAIQDGFWDAGDPHAIFGVDQKKEDLAALAQANFLPADQLRITFTPLVVNSGEKTILFDAGFGAGGPPTAGKLKSALAAAGITPEQIDMVVITHCHPDHIGGLMSDGQPTFPNATYGVGEAEFAFWSAPEQASGALAGLTKPVLANVVPLKDKITFLKNDSEVVPGIRAVEAFGHTPGHLVYHVESAGQRLMVCGDFSNHPVLSIQKPDWKVIFDMDQAKATETRRKILGMLAADRIPFTSYHMPFPCVGFVEAMGDGFRYVPASYQFSL
jgi:glyoxylase-like metal-dependent hydrolase (beta-lactamase superfamily II)